MIWVVIPAKPFYEAKRRLAPALTPPQRAELSRRLLLHVIDVARSVGQVLVVSRGPEVQALAVQAKARAITEPGFDLNTAVQAGIDRAKANRAEAVLILPADLPLLTTKSLEALITLSAGPEQSAIIAPCRHNEGTNALLLRPPDLFLPHFGPDSFTGHQAIARQLGLTPLIFRSPELAFDLDTPTDWADLTLTAPLLTHLTA